MKIRLEKSQVQIVMQAQESDFMVIHGQSIRGQQTLSLQASRNIILAILNFMNSRSL